ncbi:MAG: cysteine synthase family protein [Spirochaetota bacterium]
MDYGENTVKTMVGGTPLLELHYRYQGKEESLFAKWEPYNPTGSIKDRMAAHILSVSRTTGKLKHKMPVIEASSGNTGISFSAMASALGHPVVIFMPDWMSLERISLMKSYGAEVKLVSREEGGFLASIQYADQLAAEVGGFRPNQFSNELNCQIHEAGTGREILKQLASLGKRPAGFIAGVGTGGTVMGVGRALKKARKTVRVHPLEPANSPTLSVGKKIGKHRIQGISDDFIPPVVQLHELDEIIGVDDGDSILMAQKLGSTLGLGVGISSGANMIGAILAKARFADAYNAEQVMVTVFADDNKKYLSTDFMKEEAVKSGFITPEVELLGVRSV